MSIEPVIPVTVAYTHAAERTAVNSFGSIQALVQLAIDETNEGFRQSKVVASMALHHMYLSDIVEADMLANLREFQTTDIHGASMACLIGFYPSGNGCGIANQILASRGTGFQVTNLGCAVGYHSFGHEFGHLMGARHNLEEDPIGRFNHGNHIHRGTFNHPRGARTIMAYAPGDRVNWWSNPEVDYDGHPCGNERANNARALNMVAAAVSSWADVHVSAPTQMPLPPAPTETLPPPAPTETPPPPAPTEMSSPPSERIGSMLPLPPRIGETPTHEVLCCAMEVRMD